MARQMIGTPPGPLRVALFYIWVPGERFKAHTDAFVRSYTEHPAGCDHDLVLVCKAGTLPSRVPDLPVKSVEIVGADGFDLGPFIRLAPKFADYDRLVLVNAYCRILDDNWLAKLTAAGPLAGSAASFQVRGHLRTSCFSVRPDLLAGIAAPVTKQGCWDIEHGKQSIYRRALAQGIKALVVGREGVFEEADWCASDTFWTGEQKNLLVADNHTDKYMKADDTERAKLEKGAWGIRVGRGKAAASAPITVLTVTISGRETVVETIRSVYAQTVPVVRHLLCAHRPAATNGQVQYSAAKNDLLPAIDTEWTAVLNDDDVWLAHHVETMLPHLADADVLYSWDADRSRPRVDCSRWTKQQLVAQFERANFLDGNCLIRTPILRKVGGFPTEWVGGAPDRGGHYVDSVANYEDWELWRRLARTNARFRCVPVETWRYGAHTEGRLSA